MSTLPFEPTTTRLVLDETDRQIVCVALQEAWRRWRRHDPADPETIAMLARMERLIAELQGGRHGG